jgi:tetratricopeptide (TPR) repeat protein
VNRCRIILLVCTSLGFTVAGGSVQARDGLGTWCTFQTPQFHLISDLAIDEQRDLAELLTRFEQIAKPYLPGEPMVRPGPLKIIVFSRGRDFSRITGKSKFSGYMQPSLRTNRLLIGPVRGSLTETTLNEYAHFLSRNRLDVSLPTWFDEGLANLLGTMTFTDSQAVIGKLPAGRLRQRFYTQPGGLGSSYLTLNSTLAATSVENWPQDRINAFYDWSWLLVHYLYLEPDAPRSDGADRQAWLTGYLSGDRDLLAFLDLSRGQLRRNLERHLRNPTQVTVPVAAVEPVSGTSLCLDAYDRDHELARAILWHEPKTALRLIEPHLESAPESVELTVTRARIQLALDDPESGRQLADAARAMDPDSAAARILDADITVRDCLFTVDERCNASWRTSADLYRSALTIDPDRFDAILGLGLAYLYTGRPGEAVNYLRIAYTRAPWAAVTNYFLGESLRLVGDSRARDYLENARNWASVELWRRLAEESLRLLSTDSKEASGSG